MLENKFLNRVYFYCNSFRIGLSDIIQQYKKFFRITVGVKSILNFIIQNYKK